VGKLLISCQRRMHHVPRHAMWSDKINLSLAAQCA
jgi:hypothetical protein